MRRYQLAKGREFNAAMRLVYKVRKDTEVSAADDDEAGVGTAPSARPARSGASVVEEYPTIRPTVTDDLVSEPSAPAEASIHPVDKTKPTVISVGFGCPDPAAVLIEIPQSAPLARSEALIDGFDETKPTAIEEPGAISFDAVDETNPAPVEEPAAICCDAVDETKPTAVEDGTAGPMHAMDDTKPTAVEHPAATAFDAIDEIPPMPPEDSTEPVPIWVQVFRTLNAPEAMTAWAAAARAEGPARPRRPKQPVVGPPPIELAAGALGESPAI
jgi:hypothetical protein